MYPLFWAPVPCSLPPALPPSCFVTFVLPTYTPSLIPNPPSKPLPVLRVGYYSYSHVPPCSRLDRVIFPPFQFPLPSSLSPAPRPAVAAPQNIPIGIARYLKLPHRKATARECACASSLPRCARTLPSWACGVGSRRRCLSVSSVSFFVFVFVFVFVFSTRGCVREKRRSWMPPIQSCKYYVTRDRLRDGLSTTVYVSRSLPLASIF